MNIVCIGAGPAGLYFASSAKLRDAGHDITVIERDPPGATYGWGVVYWDDLLDALYENDRESAERIRAASTVWQEQVVSMRSTDRSYLAGYGYSVNRASLLEILAERAADLDVDVRYHKAVDDLSEFPDADLIVVAEGANSRIRQRYAEEFGTQIDQGRNPYIWLGTDRVFSMFTFDFEETPEGWIWFHAYPSSAGISTFIAECQEKTWRALGFDRLGNDETLRLLEEIFAEQLAGHSLISSSRGKPATWQRFTQVYNQTWRHDNMVLIGDAAHTTHFTIGSGTSLAIFDAIVLAEKLLEHQQLATALKEFDEEGHAALRMAQSSARSSMAWFENVDRYTNRNANEFCYAMSGRNSGQPPWRYQQHRLTQNLLVRKALRLTGNGLRWAQARRRGESRRQ
ncbi:FAD-dependent monooxygenase [Saccharopolyspora phatthalungensis]|uniref:2-polyprenyl-6-methoxyphenol hydroxylase-like FAD-dependent oxidoreductase n=1 Tax=Saccharopolyspora phatthalungensis TaxID=664693 RepID=A0A840QCS0_9PSEU|nr:FAD-dependent monooxygenase [Saccharopolyspora phatthalungensis]MBB5158534.1 2-polyprenyl-6-methoxyphenol hydroxylase-like FAD-dependent oxidoreductase [Saccharopolyspora phatthalungensis]